MELSSILNDKLINVNETKLNRDICQRILKFKSVCFIISQLSDNDAILKHNYSSMKDHLEALTNIGILKELTDGVRSGKNQCTLYIKQVPESLSSESIEEFTSKYLNQLNISWSNYSASCRKMILSSESAVLGMEASNMLNTHSYDCIAQQRDMPKLSSTNIKKSTKNRSKISKKNRKITMPTIDKNQRTILKYFHPIISTSKYSSKNTNEKFSKLSHDHGDSETMDTSSSPSYRSSMTIKSNPTSNIVRSKYFVNENE